MPPRSLANARAVQRQPIESVAIRGDGGEEKEGRKNPSRLVNRVDATSRLVVVVVVVGFLLLFRPCLRARTPCASAATDAAALAGGKQNFVRELAAAQRGALSNHHDDADDDENRGDNKAPPADTRPYLPRSTGEAANPRQPRSLLPVLPAG